SMVGISQALRRLSGMLVGPGMKTGFWLVIDAPLLWFSRGSVRNAVFEEERCAPAVCARREFLHRGFWHVRRSVGRQLDRWSAYER
ncbi:hypothetical protein AB0T83_19965, partial [Fluviibacterium sp. DFM31]